MRLCVASLIVIWMVSPCLATWTANPAISAAIKRSKAITWVNVSEEVVLRAKATDNDTDDGCNEHHSIDGEEFIDLANAEWTVSDGGSWVGRNNGPQVTFRPTVATDQNITVSVSIPDRIVNGAGARDNNGTASVSFKSYKVGCWLNVDGASQGQDVWQTGGTQASCSDSKALNLSTPGLMEDNSSYTPDNKYVTGKWTNVITPGEATLDSGGQISTPCKLEWSDSSGTAEIQGKCWDDTNDS
jgi:hypothetical protein